MVNGDTSLRLAAIFVATQLAISSAETANWRSGRPDTLAGILSTLNSSRDTPSNRRAAHSRCRACLKHASGKSNGRRAGRGSGATSDWRGLAEKLLSHLSMLNNLAPSCHEGRRKMNPRLSAAIQAFTPPIVWNALQRRCGRAGIFPWREFGFMATWANAEPLLEGKFAALYAEYGPLDPISPREKNAQVA
jgi:hypothetical protein